MALRNLTIDRAPTIPSDKTTLDVTASIINVVTNVIAIKDVPKFAEYITPLKVFLYIIKINIPIAKAKVRAINVSNIEKLEAFSKKLDLKISLNEYSKI